MEYIKGILAMVVLPASRQLDFELLGAMAGSREIHLGDEREFANLFPDCELGAMPPFGNLYGMEVFVDAELEEDDEIAFNAGALTELVRLSYADYRMLVHPRVGKLTRSL